MTLSSQRLSKLVKLLRGLINLSLGILLWICMFPILLIMFLPFAILRVGVNHLVNLIRPDLIPITNSVDHVFSASPSVAFENKNATQVWKLQGRLDVSRFRKHFYTTFLSTEELRVKYRNLFCYFVRWMAYGFKKPVDTIDLEDRIREHKLKDGESVDEFIGAWVSVNDYGDRPNWEILIIHMENNGNEINEESSESVLLFKIDHGLCDGYTFVHLVDKLTGIKSPYIVKKEEASKWRMIQAILTYPKAFLQMMIKLYCVQDPLQIYAVADKKPKWMVGFTTLDLQTVKRVRKKTDTHFNTILGNLHIGAVRSYLIETGRITSASELPEVNWIGSPTGWPEHPAMVHGGMTNHMTLNMWSNPFREEDPLRRLLGAEEGFLICEEESFCKTFKWVTLPFLWVLPSSMLIWATQNIFGKVSGLYALSPLMCSSEHYQLMGHQVDHLYLPVQIPASLPSVQMYVVPVSNSGRLDLSISVNSNLFKSQQELDMFIKVYMNKELDKLAHSCELSYPDPEVVVC